MVIKLRYCDKKMSNICKCSKIATLQVVMVNSKNPEGKKTYGYRCEEHAKDSTKNWEISRSYPLDQAHGLAEVNKYLRMFLGEYIIPKRYKQKLLVKYIKPGTGGVMCYNESTKKYKFIYYDQIEIEYVKE